jgi:F420-non-reducing hydrogenase small subunit
MADNHKPKFAMYWAASCGGCEIAVLNIGDKILEVDKAFEIVFWPVAADFKYQDVRGYPDQSIDICLFNGAVRTSENEEIAHLLRRKSKVLVAFGSCSSGGGIPALSNLTTAEKTFQSAYLDNLSTDNPERIVPQPSTQVEVGELHIPEFYDTVKALDQVVPVDYVLPGCPPEPKQIWNVLQAIIAGSQLPSPGSTVLGASDLALCEECPLEKHEKQIEQFFRPFEIVPDPDVCLLEQGLFCMGPATRGGCGALCPQAGMGCRGCYGPLAGVEDQGVRMLSAVASSMNLGSPSDEESELEEMISHAMDTLVDPAGTLYRFGMAHSHLKRARDLSGENGSGGVR